jgi:hypothetical protein
MRIHELLNGLRTPLSNEESRLVKKIKNHCEEHDEPFFRATLDEREQEVAKNLVSRGVLTRTKKDGKICYKVCSASSVWRI